MSIASKSLESGVDMIQDLRRAVDLLKSDKNARAIFEAVKEGRGRASGWQIVKTVGLEPEEVNDLLAQLKFCGVIETTDSGLAGYYSLTSLGFMLRIGYSVVA
jgi:predicted transcriptional regulator